MRKTIILAVAALLACASAFAAGTSEQGLSGTYAFGGSTTVMPVMEEAIEVFTKANPKVKITYEGQGSSVGIQGVIDGVYSMGGSSREVKKEEEAKGVLPTAIALDGITVIVNKGVSVAGLTLEQVGKIFTGEVANWKDLGGQDAPIVVVNRDEASGTRAAFLELVLDVVFGKGKAKFLANAVTVESNGDMVTKVGTTPNAVGYCGFGYIDQARQAGGKDLVVNGVEATVANVLNKKYPISRSLYVVTKGAPKAGSVEKAFLDYLLSADGQAIVKKTGFIALPK